FRIAGLVREGERTLVMPATLAGRTGGKLQAAAQVGDAGELSREIRATGTFLGRVERRESLRDRALHPVPGCDADPCRCALAIVGRGVERGLERADRFGGGGN